jgi:hypothetical protein
VWPVLKQHNETKSQNDEQNEPKKAAQKRHVNRLTRAHPAINTGATERQRLEWNGETAKLFGHARAAARP